VVDRSRRSGAKPAAINGCLAATKRACGNRLLIRRTLLERVLLAEVEHRIPTDDRMRRLFDRAERELTAPTSLPVID
jgi:hypothetical protein